ncbi:hypothetical protein ACQP2T_04095 [Nonomuraea sp. CA-143628]|uniref:hypothetical protein n=1 Tax=Nonomuraea sp. CA-143628 TaxID=3239997 RepID=UPI003D9260F4
MHVIRGIAASAAFLAGLVVLSAGPASAEASPKGCYRGYVCFWREGQNHIHYKTPRDESPYFGHVTASKEDNNLWVFNNGNSDHLPAVSVSWGYANRFGVIAVIHHNCFTNNPHKRHKGVIGKRVEVGDHVSVTSIHWVKHC